jgi:DNA-directed RNA polymerase specialized sigma24 family protein
VTVDERESLADQFEANRTHLRAVGYRMLGSVSEADDAVQEAWLRLNRSDTSGVENLDGRRDLLRTRQHSAAATRPRRGALNRIRRRRLSG